MDSTADYIDWNSLLLPAISPESAKLEFRGIGAIQAIHPTNHPGSKPITLLFYDLARDSDHYLYKADTDFAGREFAMQEREEDYQIDRAERLRWIRPVMEAPHFIYEHSKKKNRFLYVCRTESDSFYAVIVDRHSQRLLHFVTAYVVDAQKWKTKRHVLIRHYPPTNKSKHKKGQRSS